MPVEHGYFSLAVSRFGNNRLEGQMNVVSFSLRWRAQIPSRYDLYILSSIFAVEGGRLAELH